MDKSAFGMAPKPVVQPAPQPVNMSDIALVRLCTLWPMLSVGVRESILRLAVEAPKCPTHATPGS